MSFAGVSSRQKASRQVTGGPAKTKKPKARRKPVWDSTVNDLNVFKATPEELDRRKEVHRSQNADVLKEEQLKKKIAKARQKSHFVDLTAHRSSASLLKEMLLDNSQMDETLMKSDTLLSAVRNILSDHKRVQGLPNVTQAPTNVKTKIGCGNGLFEMPVSHLDELSISVMDKKALNEDLDKSFSTTDSEETENTALEYRPQMDLARFQRLINELDKEKVNGNNDALKTARLILNHVEQDARKKPAGTVENEKPKRIITEEGAESKQIAEETPVSTPVKDRAINDTARVNRTRTRLDQGMANGNAGATMEDFYKVLDTVNSNLSEYERQAGRVGNSSVLPSASCTGYTKALLDAVVRMSCYLKENADRLNVERALKETLLQEVQRLNGFVDALSTDIVSMQEAYARLQNEFVKSRRETEHQLLVFRKVLALNGIVVPMLPIPQPGLSLNMTNADGHLSNDPASSYDSVAVNAGHAKAVSLDGPADPVVSHVSQPCLQLPRTQATMLLPPQQMDSPSVTSGRQTHLVTQSLDGVRGVLCFEGEAGPSLTKQSQNSDLLSHHFSAPLLSQSDPFSQQGRLPLGASHQQSDVPPGRPVSMQSSVHDNRMFLPGSSQQFSGTGEQRVEQRNLQNQLVEINRQQAEAQRKLEELIERQQREVKGAFLKQAVSPSISPITAEPEKLPDAQKFDSTKSASAITTKELSSSYKEANPIVQTDSSIQLHNAGPVRQIKVTVPQAPPGDEMLTSSPDLIPGNLVKRFSGSSVPLVGKTSHSKPQVVKNGGFFALTTHLPAR